MIPPGVQLCREKGSDSVSEGNAIGKAKAATSHRCADRKSSPSPRGARARCQEEHGGWAAFFGKFSAAAPSGSCTISRAAVELAALEITAAHVRPNWGSLEQGAALPGWTRMRSGRQGATANAATSARWMLTGALRLHRSNWRPTCTDQRFSQPRGHTPWSPMVPRHLQDLAGTDSLGDPVTGRGPRRCCPQSHTRAWGRRRAPPSPFPLRAAL